MENAKEYWDELERRYFDGETTEAEEAELERHIAELAKRGTVNATTATMAYTAVGREVPRRLGRKADGADWPPRQALPC